jgi:hypothetical protein
MTIHNQPATAPEELIWGAKNIAVAIRRSKSSAFAMLEQGKIPGAKKVGGRWCFRPAVFRAAFENLT